MARPVMDMSGAQRVIDNMQALGLKVENKAVKKAINDGTKPMLRAAKKNWPKDTGASKKELIRTVKRSRKTKGYTGYVGPKSKTRASKLSRLIEHGNVKTRPRRRKKIGASSDAEKWEDLVGGSTGNMPALRPITRAFESSKREAESNMKRRIIAEVK